MYRKTDIIKNTKGMIFVIPKTKDEINDTKFRIGSILMILIRITIIHSVPTNALFFHQWHL